MRGERRESLYYERGARSPSPSSSYASSSPFSSSSSPAPSSPSPPLPPLGDDINNGGQRLQNSLDRHRQTHSWCPPLRPSLVTSRPVNVVGEAKLLQRDCQFVKRTINHGGVSTYITGDLLVSDKEGPNHSSPKDPRQRIFSWPSPVLRPVLLTWDETTSRGPPPSRELLLDGISLPSKALLVTLIEAATGISRLADLIEDVQLAADCALLTMRDPGNAVRLLKRLEGKSLGTAGDITRVKFDPGGHQFAKQKSDQRGWVEPKKTFNHKTDQSIREPFPRQDHRKRKKSPSPPPNDASVLKCSRRVPCLLIDYRDIPASEPAASVEEAFCRCRIFNVERAAHEWHVHLASQAEIDYVQRWRERFLWQGRPVPFATRTFENSPPSRFSEERNREWTDEGRNTTKSQSVDLLTHQRKISMVSLDELYGQQHTIEGKFEEQILVDIDEQASGTLPIFNKRYLERSRMVKPQTGEGMAETQEGLPITEVTTTLGTSPPKGATSSLESPKGSPPKSKRLTKTKKLGSLSSMIPQSTMIESPKTLSRSETPRPDIHQTGCARTEGYYKQRPEEKIVYWEDITKSLDDGSHIIFDPRAIPAAAGMSAPSTMTGRSARAQNRRLHWETSSATKGSLVAADYFAKTSALAARQKKLILGRSSIHSWGLFAGEDIEAGDMVIEYVGEIIRHSVANVRERTYELALRAQGSKEIASSYFFRLDTDLVLDATHKGNLSRFINHSCDPSCLARVMTLDGARRIVMYARRDIRRGEELTYDYKFPLEDDPAKKITCLCGARNCRGTLN